MATYKVDTSSNGTELLWQRDLMNSTSLEMVARDHRQCIPLGVNDHEVLRPVKEVK
jgi:hypothetical protein